jgi:Protein of unknown function (DUF3124)
MRGQVSWQGLVLAIVLFAGGLLLGSYRNTAEPIHSSVSERLQPVSADAARPAQSATVYVPVYSSVYLGISNKTPTAELAATLSVRNTSSMHPITLESVRYYDSSGKRVRDYLDKPSTLAPLGSVEFVVQRSDVTGGPGANFLVQWAGPSNVDEPLIEAVMVGQAGGTGISFTSRGHRVKSGPRE